MHYKIILKRLGIIQYFSQVFGKITNYYETGTPTRQWFLLALLGFVLCLLHTGFYAEMAWQNYGGGDWDLFYFTSEVSRIIIQEYGEIPQWNPWSRGDVEMFANPQTFHFSPQFLLFLVFSTPTALKLSLFLYYWIGFMGMLAWLKRLGRSTLTALFGTYIFTFCSFFTWHIICVCHPNTTGLFLTPWLLYYYQAYKEKGWQLSNYLIPIIIFAYLILSGSSYPMVYMPIFLFLYVLADTYANKLSYKHLLYPLIVVNIGFGLTLWKLYPSYKYMSQNPRHYKDESYINFIGVLQSLGDRPNSHLTIDRSLTNWGWWEHAAYFELIGIVLLIYYRKQLNLHIAWWFLAGFILWWSMGNFLAPLNPWYVANHYLPVFKSFRVPYRFEIFYILLLCLWLTTLLDQKHKEHPLWGMIMLVWCINLFVVNNSIHQTLFHTEPIKEKLTQTKFDKDSAFRQTCIQGMVPSGSFYPPNLMYPRLLQNIGMIDAYEPLEIPYNGFKTCKGDTLFGLVKQEDAKILSWTPSTIRLFAYKANFYIQQNYAEGWFVEAGDAKVERKANLLFINTQPGTTLLLRYRNPYIEKGTYLSIPFGAFFIVGLGFVVFKRKKTTN